MEEIKAPIRRYKNLVLYWFGGKQFLLALPFFKKRIEGYEEAKREFNNYLRTVKHE